MIVALYNMISKSYYGYRSNKTNFRLQTRALATIARVIRTHGEPAHSFVYDSLLSHVTKQQQQHRSGTGTPGSVQVHNTSTTTTALLWELSAIPVISEFLKFDLENYTLALVSCLVSGFPYPLSCFYQCPVVHQLCRILTFEASFHCKNLGQSPREISNCFYVILSLGN